MSAYLVVLNLHNVSRWFVLIAAVVLLAQLLPGLWGRAWGRPQRVAGAVYTGLMDLQLVLGLALYFGLSPVAQAALADFGAAMRNDQLRFFAVEHSLGMIVAVAFAHVGSALSRRAATEDRKFRVALIWYGFSVILLVAMIPWWRPLLPGS